MVEDQISSWLAAQTRPFTSVTTTLVTWARVAAALTAAMSWVCLGPKASAGSRDRSPGRAAHGERQGLAQHLALGDPHGAAHESEATSTTDGRA